jgi:hypothetical protein
MLTWIALTVISDIVLSFLSCLGLKVWRGIREQKIAPANEDGVITGEEKQRQW